MLKKRLSLLLAVLLLIPAAGCGKQASGGNEFSWFIPKTDGYGEYYSTYEEAVPIQWLNSQYWDVESGTLGSEGSGEKLTLSFKVPIAGAEKDYLGNMFASGDMADVIDLSYSADSPQRLVEDGSLMEITDYVEQYLPNYVAYLDANPDIKKFLTVTDEAGKVHYYALYCVKDVPGDNFMGYVYRRDWVVAYADVPSHVWDLDAVLKDPADPTSVDTSKINYTNYYDALAADDWTGWKESTVTKFTSSEDPADPDSTYTDNVVFPSGSTTPVYISGWEWMFHAFAKALEAEGLAGQPDAYCFTLFYEGVLGTGDLYSSFGGGNPWWYVNAENEAAFGGGSENMRTYLDAMHTWYANGWMDTAFQTRSGDAFYKINTTGFSSGYVGMSQMGMTYVGDTIRATQHAGATTQAMVMGCALPINDMYGDDSQKFVTPDSMYTAPVFGNPFGIAATAADKNLPLLFTFFNWLYSEEGFRYCYFGLNEEQYQSMSFEPDYYKDYDVTSTYTYDEGSGLYARCEPAQTDINLQGALSAQRLILHEMNLKIQSTYSSVVQDALQLWRQYSNTTDATLYNPFMSTEQSNTYAKRLSSVQTYMDQTLPGFIRDGVADSAWDEYTTILGKYNYQEVVDIYNAVVQQIA